MLNEAGEKTAITLGSYTGLYSLAIGFVISLIFIVVISLATKAPEEEIIKEFEKVADKNIVL